MSPQVQGYTFRMTIPIQTVDVKMGSFNDFLSLCTYLLASLLFHDVRGVCMIITFTLPLFLPTTYLNSCIHLQRIQSHSDSCRSQQYCHTSRSDHTSHSDTHQYLQLARVLDRAETCIIMSNLPVQLYPSPVNPDLHPQL